MDSTLILPDTLISFGGSIKALETDGNLVTVGAPGMLWGSPAKRDLVGDWFTRRTDRGPSKGLGVKTMLHHGIPLSPELKEYSDVILPDTIKADEDEDALFVATVLNMANAHHRRVMKGIEAKAFAWSSGANPATMQRKVYNDNGTGEILKWDIREFSFTPTPCEGRLLGSIAALKAFLDSEEYQESEPMRLAVKCLTDTSYSAEVPLDLKYSADQPRDDDGRWTVIRGTSYRHKGEKVGEHDIHKIADDLELSGHARNALLKAHRDGLIKTDEHLYRTIASADDAMSEASHSSRHTGIIASAAKLHGTGGKFEGKRWPGAYGTHEKAPAEWYAADPKDAKDTPAGGITDYTDTLNNAQERNYARQYHMSKRHPDKYSPHSEFAVGVSNERAAAIRKDVDALHRRGRKSIDESDLPEILSALKSGHVDLKFVEHTDMALAAVAGLVSRIEDKQAKKLSEMQAGIKSGAVLSADKYSQLDEIRKALYAHADKLGAVIDPHKPANKTDEEPLDTASNCTIPQPVQRARLLAALSVLPPNMSFGTPTPPN